MLLFTFTSFKISILLCMHTKLMSYKRKNVLSKLFCFYIFVFFVWNAIISVQHLRWILNLHSFTQQTYLFVCKQIYIDTLCKMRSNGNVFKIRSICFKVIYLMTNQSLSSTFLPLLNAKYKILANVPSNSVLFQSVCRARIRNWYVCSFDK